MATADPPYHALVDTGALVTGFDNLGVAEYLLRRGLRGFDACVFLDARDRKMALLRVGMTVVRLEQCGAPLDRRFTFYDQTHTTGMDIKQFYTARAAVTLGKDMTFRDLAQGAYRCGSPLTGLAPDLRPPTASPHWAADLPPTRAAPVGRQSGPARQPEQAAAAAGVTFPCTRAACSTPRAP